MNLEASCSGGHLPFHLRKKILVQMELPVLRMKLILKQQQNQKAWIEKLLDI